jgi:prepilin-type N-terminal cleavage/methylation domain-containing protein
MFSFYNYFTYKAYTLIELLLVMLLLAIILCITIPGWQLLLQHNSEVVNANRIVTILEYTRNLAIKKNKNIALCRKNFRDSKNNKDWSSGQLVIDVQNGSQLYELAAIAQQDQLLWVSSLNKNDCIEFMSTGELEGQQGSFYYCYGRKHAVEIILQETGNVSVRDIASCPNL